MKAHVMKPIVVDIKYLKVIIPNPSLEDYTINGNEVKNLDELPFSNVKNNSIEFAIDIDNGNILGWEKGSTLSVCDKVRDGGEYWLMDENYTEIVSTNNPYVPNMLDTQGDGFGDYMQFSVDKEGYIKNWRVEFSDFNITLLS